MDDATCLSTLLHEMAHAATTDIHGNRWKAEMIRLRDSGAPFVPPDDCVKMEDWSGGRVTKDQFSGAARDILIEIPTATARQIIRFFINNEGGPASTVATFLRKYPWAMRVCGALKKERAESAKRRDDFLARQKTSA
jgi:hypothetical protein